MNIEFIGHSGFIIHTPESILIQDPWLSEDGAFDSSWFQFPCNHHMAKRVIELIRDNNACLYISHEHNDHFDKSFLKKIVKYQPQVIIANFKLKILKNQIEKIGFKIIHEINDNETKTINTIKVTIFIDDKGINTDSAILTEYRGKRFLNLNDCKIYDRLKTIKDQHGEIALLAAQFSGAIWHPVCYEYTAEKYEAISNFKKHSKFENIHHALKTIKPMRYLPSAGPPVFLDPILFEINFQPVNIFPMQHEIIKHLKLKNISTNVDALMPGDRYDLNSDIYTSNGNINLSQKGIRSYLINYAKKYAHLFSINGTKLPLKEAKNVLDELKKHLEEKLDAFTVTCNFEYSLYFSVVEIPNMWIQVDLNSKNCFYTKHLPLNEIYAFQAHGWVFRKLVKKIINWSEWMLSLRVNIIRKPDIYNTYVNLFLMAEADTLQSAIGIINATRNKCERITIDANGKQYNIKRYCPHQGGDLKYGWLEDGCWVCPKHHWKFDLELGGLCLSSNESIDAKKSHI